MGTYNNRQRLGLRSSTSPNPKNIAEDIDENIRRLDPEATPLQTLSMKLGRGKKPVSHKIQVMQYNSFDNLDHCSAVVLGSSIGANFARFALLTVDQASRPDTNVQMYYYPQDKFFNVITGQVYEVWMTPDASIKYNGTAEWTTDAALSGNSTTRTAAGTVLVRNIEPAAVKDFDTADLIFLGRTIVESQKIEAMPAQRDVLFDCNFVEHKEKVITMTEDQKVWIETKLSMPDWTFQQKEMLMEMKKDVEYNAFWSEREDDFTQTSRPKRHMRGLFHSIRTNVAYYDPSTLTDFEAMFSNFLFEQAFRYNPTGKSKIGMAGGRFLYDFNMAFREYRRTSDLSGIGKEIGLDADTYVIPGGFKLTLIRNEILRQGTPMEYWCFVIDPSLAEWRIVKDYNSRLYQNPDERDIKLMVEWQGTIAWHLEQVNALLRTTGM